MWTWYLSRQRTLPSRANSISNSTSPCFTGSRQIVQSSPALGPPHMPSGRRLGNFPAWITARAFSRRVRSSSTRSSMDRTSNRSVRIGGRHLPSPYTKRRVPGGDDERTSASHAQCGRRGRRRVRAGDRRHGPVRRRAGAAPAGRAELRPHRSQAEREKDYVEAVRALGAPRLVIALKHVLPNVISPFVVQGTVAFSQAILIEASLSYLGLSAQPPTPSWGNMLNEGRTYLETAPWISVFPGIAIMLSVLAFNLIGDGLRDILDPNVQ